MPMFPTPESLPRNRTLLPLAKLATLYNLHSITCIAVVLVGVEVPAGVQVQAHSLAVLAQRLDFGSGRQVSY